MGYFWGIFLINKEILDILLLKTKLVYQLDVAVFELLGEKTANFVSQCLPHATLS